MAATPAPEQPGENTFRRFLLVTLLVYALVQPLWIRATPLQAITLPDNLPAVAGRNERPLVVGIGPDEKEHFLYVLSLAERGRVPRPDPSRRTSPEEFVSYQAQHPPLFYAVAAVFYKLFGGALGPSGIWYLLRGLCAVFGAVTVALAARAARVAFPDRPLVAYGVGPAVAFLPMFGHMTGCLSNEPMAMALGAWAWLQAVRLVRSETPPTLRDGLLLGATLGLAALTRLTALLWLPAALVALVYAVRRAERPSWTPLFAALGVFALLLAPWLLYNQAAYGQAFLRTFDRPLLARGPLSDFFGRGIVPAEFPVPISAGVTALWYASTSWWPFWLVQFYVPNGLFSQALFLLLGLFLLALLGLHARSRTNANPQEPGDDTGGKAIVWAAAASLAFCVAALVQQQLFSDWNVVLSAGRYTVAAAPAGALLLCFALSTLGKGRGGGTVAAVAPAVLAAAMLAFDLYAAALVTRFYTDNPAQPEVQPITTSGVYQSGDRFALAAAAPDRRPA